MSDLADKVVLLWQVEGVAGRGAAQVHPGRGAAVVPGHQHGEGSDDDHPRIIGWGIRFML